MSRLYELMVLYNNDKNVDGLYEFYEYLMDTIHYLSIKHKTDKMEQYKLVFYRDKLYGNIDFNKVRFMASNKYELLLKVNKYFLANMDNRYLESYDQMFGFGIRVDEELPEYFCEHYKYTHNDHDAMVKTVDDMLLCWEDGDTLWWEKEEYVLF